MSQPNPFSLEKVDDILCKHFSCSDPFLLTVAERKDQEVGNWNWIISADVTVKEIGVLNAED